MIPPSTTETTALHAEYCRLTKLEHKYTMQAHFMIESWAVAGYTLDDLKLVTAYIWKRIKEGKRQRESFKFTVLFGDIPKWEDDLSMARAEALHKPTMASGKREVLKATGRATEALMGTPERSVAQILAESQALEALRALKDTL